MSGDFLPLLASVDYSPAILSLGESLGQRASLRLTFIEQQHSDTGEGFDPYLADRAYNPFTQGTFWGKFRARQPFLRGKKLRWISGRVGKEHVDLIEIDIEVCSLTYGVSPCTASIPTTGTIKCFNTRSTCQDKANYDPETVTLRFGPATATRIDALEDEETRHFIVDGFEGPTPAGQFTIVAKDPLKALDSARALCPLPSKGFLAGAIDDNDTAATLSPSGIGDADYPASGYLNIGGKEIVSFTRTADALTITRAQLGTTASAHEAQDRVQLCKRWTAEDPAAVLAELFTDFAGLDAAWVPEDDWLAETAFNYRHTLTATIAEPTPVKQLAAEVIAQAALAVWWDDREEEIRLQVLREIATDAAIFDDDSIIAGAEVNPKDQLDKRISQVWVYYGQINPLRPIDELANYRSSEIVVDTEAEADYGDVQYKAVVARFIPELGRSAANRLGTLMLGRFRTAPRKMTFSTFRRAAVQPVLGQGYRVESVTLQDATGARESVPARIVRLKPTARHYEIEAEEDRFIDLSTEDIAIRSIPYDFDTFDRNMRTDHDTLYAEPEAPPDGAWSPGTYNEGQIVSHEGDYWIVNTSSTTEEPGDGATDWDLYLRIIFRVGTGRVIGSTSVLTPALRTGLWPAGLEPILVNPGFIVGKPGKGGKGGFYRALFGADQIIHATDGEDGGKALLVEDEIRLDNTGGVIGGGGGGGGGGGAKANGIGNNRSGGGGGAGAGASPSAGGQPGNNNAEAGSPGTLTTGGEHGDGQGGSGNNWGRDGGDGGDLGQPGDPGLAPGGTDADAGEGGEAGDAIDGISLVTVIAAGTILGDQIN